MGNADTHREIHDLFNGRDFDAVAKRLTDHVHYTDNPRGIGITGPDAFKEWLGEWTAGMSNAWIGDARYVDAGDTTIATFTGRGLHDGQFGPFPPTGRDISFALCEILTYDRDGKVAGGEIYYDQAWIAAQLATHAPVVTSLAARRVSTGDARTFENGEMRVVSIAGVTLGRAEFRPGWKWSNDVKPVAGTRSCEVSHTGYVISGRMHIVMDDGTEGEAAAGDLMLVPPGHDAWTVGDESCVVLDWAGSAQYAVPT